MVVGFCGILLFFFVPETFWDRTPIPRQSRRIIKRPSFFSRRSSAKNAVPRVSQATNENAGPTEEKPEGGRPAHHRHVGFAPGVEDHSTSDIKDESYSPRTSIGFAAGAVSPAHEDILAGASTPGASSLKNPDSPYHPPRPHNERKWSTQSALSPMSIERANGPSKPHSPVVQHPNLSTPKEQPTPSYFQDLEAHQRSIRAFGSDTESEKMSFSNLAAATRGQVYTHRLREAPRQTFKAQLKIHNGRLNQDKWWKVAVRPFVLFSYPAVLWSAAIYACSVGWLIVISECVAVIYREGSYQFGALSTGLVYISPFIGGVLGTAVAGRVSDVIVKAMARRNGGLYEPEFRLVMAIPIAISTLIGLIGFGWSAEVEDPWIAPTLFFGVVSFGCSLGSTTSITFCVDSYRQYAGEALVTLNFSKNVLHGLVFSFFVTGWLKSDGSKTVFMWIGIIQLIILLFTIPMYIYGKRARMWTVRMNFMEKL